MASTTWLSTEQQATWRAYVASQELLRTILERDLLQCSSLSMPDYALLVVLSEAPEGRLQSRDLACELTWEKSRLSHQVKRMESRGLVERTVCDSDARASMINITAEGLTAIREAAPFHVAKVHELIFDVLSPKDSAELGRICGLLFDGVQDTDNCG